MAIHQINLWKCEKCNYTESTCEEVNIYSGCVVVPKENRIWDYLETDKDRILLCPECLVKSKQHPSVSAGT